MRLQDAFELAFGGVVAGMPPPPHGARSRAAPGGVSGGVRGGPQWRALCDPVLWIRV